MVEYIFRVSYFDTNSNQFHYLYYLNEKDTRYAHHGMNIIEVIPIDPFTSIYDQACRNTESKKIIHRYE
jgi:hypothetical protein